MEIPPDDTEFDFVRYFTRVQKIPFWHKMQVGMADFARKHLVNWAGVAENNRRWSASDLQQLFTAANFSHFTTQTTLGGLARYAKGRKSN